MTAPIPTRWKCGACQGEMAPIENWSNGKLLPWHGVIVCVTTNCKQAKVPIAVEIPAG